MINGKKLVVIALGGNAIKKAGEEGTAEDQFRNVSISCEQLVKMNKQDYLMVLTHGNGPQAGNLLIQQEEGSKLVPSMPLDVVDAMTQGEIGYMFQNQLQNAFRRDGREIPIASLITQMIVDENDPDFQDPSKPVGPFYTEDEAKELEKSKGYIVKETRSGTEKNWQRVVPSPAPIGLVEAKVIRTLVGKRVIVITSGGGGIPVMKQPNGELVGIEAVVDKDMAGMKLAQVVDGDIYLVLTDVDHVFINYGKENEKPVRQMTTEEAKQYLADGQFPEGSMAPKIRACIAFVENGGERAIITSINNAVSALKSESGTEIVLN